MTETLFKKCRYFYPNNFKFCAIKKNYNSKFDLKIKELLDINWRKPDVNAQ